MLHLFLAIDGFMLQVGVPVESNAFEGSDELLRQPIPFSFSITARFNKMCNMLFGFALFNELIELWRLISMRHAKSINPLRIRLCMEMCFVGSSS